MSQLPMAPMGMGGQMIAQTKQLPYTFADDDSGLVDGQAQGAIAALLQALMGGDGAGGIGPDPQQPQPGQSAGVQSPSMDPGALLQSLMGGAGGYGPNLAGPDGGYGVQSPADMMALSPMASPANRSMLQQMPRPSQLNTPPMGA